MFLAFQIVKNYKKILYKGKDERKFCNKRESLRNGKIQDFFF